MTSMERYLIYYYLQKGFYSEVLTLTCSTSQFKLYKCLVFVMAGQYAEAICRLNEINTNEEDVNQATLLLLIFSHKKCVEPDASVISTLEVKLKQAHPCANEKSLTLASLCLYFTRHLDKAQGLAEKVLKLNCNNVDALLVNAWVELEKNKTRKSHYINVNGLMRHIITLDSKCIPALLGEISTSSTSDRLSKLNRLLVQFPGVAPPLIEKMELALERKDWQQCQELSERLLSINNRNIFANKIKLFHLINVLGNYEEAAVILDSVGQTILQQELPDPCTVLFDWAKLFARICGRNTIIISSTLKYMQHCNKLYPTSVPYLEELAFQNFLLGNYEEALHLYRMCLKLDDTSLSLLTGMTMCQFEVAGRVINDQIAQQLDLLTEISGKTLSPYVRLIQLTQLKPSQAKPILENIVRDIMDSLTEKRFGFEYLIDLNVDVLLRVLVGFMKLDTPQVSSITLLEHITTLIPGLWSACLLLSYIYADGETSTLSYAKSKKILNAFGKTRPEYSVAQMMLALIYVREDDLDKAFQHLDLALSNDLKLIETPLYNLLRGVVEEKNGRVGESTQCLRTARQLIHSKQGAQMKLKSVENPLDLACLKFSILHTLTPCEVCRLYQVLCSNLVKSQPHSTLSELDGYIAEASILLKDTKYWLEFSIIIAQVKEKTDPSAALQLLSQVPQQHEKYVEAMEKMAHVYLTSLNNPEKYISCYRALLDKDPSTKNFVRLADAYLHIQDADKAVLTYEEAKRRNPEARFGVKLARIFVKTHQYEKAISCFRENDTHEEGLLELAALYTKLGQLNSAQECLQKIQNPELTAPVFAKIREKSHDIKGAYQVLKQAIDSCDKLRTPDIYRQLADYATQLRDFTSAISHYRKLLGECLSKQEMHAVHIALTRLYMQTNDWKSCEALCTQLLNNSGTNSDNDTNKDNNRTSKDSNRCNEINRGSNDSTNTELTARLILADATFRRGDFQAASEHFRSLLEKTEFVNYTALARYIEIHRRLATLSSLRDESLLAALIRNRTSQPGFYYCQGLLEWYSGNPMKALGLFHKAKHDTEWGTQSLHNMVEICLANPEVVGSTPSGTTALELAETLIKEMNPSSAEEEWSCKLLSTFLRCASHDRIDVEMAMNEFTRLAQNEGTRVGASLGLARCYVSQNQQVRAKNILKLLAKAVWNFEEANYLEACWLLLAELYLQDSKPERAEDLIQRSLHYNKSSTKSYELLAGIAESRELYEDAVKYYKQACSLHALVATDLSLHQKYVALLLKLKRYADCIGECQVINRVSPNIAANVQAYEKALTHLRT